MKKLVLTLLSVFSLSAFAQNTLTVTVSDSGTVAPGVAVFYYNSPASFYPNGYNNPPVIENFDAYAFTSGNGVASFTLNNIFFNDTVFWATKDCSGNVIWGAGSPTTMMPNINGTLWLGCLPGACDAVLTVDSAATPAANLAIVQAFPLRKFSNTGLPSNIPSLWSVNGSIFQSGFTSADYDSITFNMNTLSAPYNVSYYRVDSICSSVSTSFGNTGGGGGASVTCNPAFFADTLGQTATGYGMLFRDASMSNGTIINYQWDFGDGNALNGATSNPIHNYANPGTYAVCLTITAVLGADTCSSTYCDSAIFVPAGAGGGNPNPITCAASYMVDTLNSGLFQNQLIIWESSYSNGNIISYSWDFGDGTIINTRYPSHTYATTGVYPVCLTIVAIDSAGVDTCSSTFCDSIGFDANGNLVYKEGQNGFTINVIDPSTVGVEELLLNESLAMYPNPASEKVNLSWDEALAVDEISVYTISGQQIRNLKVEGSKAQITNLAAGAYLVRVHSSTASKTLRLIVQ